MNRWQRVNALLGLLAALLLGALLWPDNTRTPDSALTQLMPQDINTIRVERGKRLIFTLQRDANGWLLTYPSASRASNRRVNQLLAIALAPKTTCFVPDSDRYGLSSPKAVLQLNELRFAFGDRDPTQQARYVQIDDEVCVIDDVYFNLVTLPAKHFAAN